MPYADESPSTTPLTWRGSLLAPLVWKRAACYGLPAGLIQAALNQGDFWLTGEVTAVVAVKSVMSPLVGFGVAFLAAVTTHHDSCKPSIESAAVAKS